MSPKAYYRDIGASGNGGNGKRKQKAEMENWSGNPLARDIVLSLPACATNAMQRAEGLHGALYIESSSYIIANYVLSLTHSDQTQSLSLSHCNYTDLLYTQVPASVQTSAPFSLTQVCTAGVPFISFHPFIHVKYAFDPSKRSPSILLL